jgi:2-oxoglutarate dehydrogenase E1 component
VERGTFSHRHAVLHDQVNESKYIPLNNISAKQAAFAIYNSNLSEYAVLGFELGYSMENPNSLVLWEAQFGDFSNTAQVIIDQFISSGEQKWLKGNGLVMLLPHGYEGQGPEHSSARVERFLQMCDDDPDFVPEMEPTGVKQIQDVNMQVCIPSTPANYFHLLRRQIRRDFRKPLICINPKSLLRHPQCQSDLSLFYDKDYQRLLPDELTDVVADASVKRIIFCAGRVYYDLTAERKKRQVKDVVIVRVEQVLFLH